MKTKNLWVSIIAFFMMLTLVFGVNLAFSKVSAAESNVWEDWRETTVSANPFGGDNANQSTGTDATYGDYIQVSDSDGSVYFYTPWITDRTNYEKLGVYVYNCGASDVSGYYNDWTTGSYNVNFTLKAGEWTLVTFEDHYITCGNNYLYITGTFRFTDVYGFKGEWVETTVSSHPFSGDNANQSTGTDATYGDYIQVSDSGGSVYFYTPWITDRTNYEKLGVYVYNCGASDVSGYYNDWTAGSYDVRFTLKAGEWTLITFTDHYITCGNNYLYIIGTFRFSAVYGYKAVSLDEELARAVIAQIEVLPTLESLTIDDESAVIAAREAFNALTLEQQALVTNADVLTAAEAKIAELKANRTIWAGWTKTTVSANPFGGDNANQSTGTDATYGDYIQVSDSGGSVYFYTPWITDRANYEKLGVYVYNCGTSDVSGYYNDWSTGSYNVNFTLKAGEWTLITFTDHYITCGNNYLYISGTFRFTNVYGTTFAEEVSGLISVLPEVNELTDVTAKLLDGITSAQAAYAALSEEDKAKVVGYTKLTALMDATANYKVLLAADEASKLTSGRDTGNPATVGTAVDATYGNVWTLNAAADSSDFHANVNVDTTGYDNIEFYIYNPASENVTVVWYNSSWANLANITAVASSWTKVSLLTANFAGTFFVIANHANVGEWKVSSFVGVNMADPAVVALNERIAALPAVSEIQDISHVKYIFEVDSIQAAYVALTSEQQAEVENYAKVAEVESALSMFKMAVEVAADGAISTGHDSGNTATAVTATTDEYYGKALSITFNAGQASFRTDGLDRVMNGYKSVAFYIYNPTASDDVLVWYLDGWGNGVQNITMKAGAWTEVTLSMETYTENSFFIINKNAGGGTWLISDIYGITKEITLTIKDAEGNVLASGEDAISYDTSALNVDGYVFIGFEYDGKLYRNVEELRNNVDEVMCEVLAKTIKLKVVDGASVRITGNSGLRFTADIENGYTDFGMIFTGAQLLNGEFTKENLDALSIKYKHVYSTMDGFNSTENDDGSIRFSIVLQNIKEANYTQLFTARAYATITYFDGSTSNVYSVYETAKHARSVQQVAIMAMADTDETYTSGQWYTLRKYEGATSAEDKLVNADHWSTEWTVIKSGSNTGNSGTVGQTVDATFGNVFTLTMQQTGSVSNGDFFPIAGMEIGSYTYVRFYVYNPAMVDIGLVAYDASWGNGATIATLKARDWTEVNVKCATYGTNPFFIVNSSECFNKEFKITSFYGVKGSNEELVESYVKTLNIDGTKVFDIMAYGGPASGVIHENRAEYNGQNIWVRYYQTATVADVKKYVDAGYEYWCADDAWYGRSFLKELAGMSYEHDVYWALDMAAEYYQRYGKELPVIVTLDKLASAMKGETGYTTDAEKTAFKAWLSEAVQNLKNYKPSNGGKNFFAGIQLCDEPIYVYAESYTYWYNYLATDLGLVSDGYVLTGAFFGLEATQSQIANNGSTSGCTTSQYKAYLNAFMDNQTEKSVLLYDNYPFQVKDTWFSDQYLICDSYFENMQVVSQVAREKGVQAGIAIQSMGWEVGDGSSKYYYYTESEANISMQVYAALAYGYTYFNYFVYTQPYNFTDHEVYNQAPVVWNESEKTFAYTDLYTYVDNVNNEVKSFEEVLMSFDYLGTQLVTGKTTGGNFGNTVNYEENAIVASSKGAVYDMAIGYFEQNGTKAYLIANVDNPHNNRTNTATLNLGEQYTKAIVYVDGVATIQALTNGTLDVSLARGEGLFVIPIA